MENKYFCKICGHQNSSRQAYHSHLKSKKHKRTVEMLEMDKQKNLPSNNINNAFLTLNAVNTLSLSNNEIKCEYCDKIFARKDNLLVHIKRNRCKVKKEQDILKQKEEENKEKEDLNITILIKKVEEIKETLEVTKEENNKKIEEIKEENNKKIEEIKEENKEIKEENKEIKNKHKQISEELVKVKLEKTINNTIYNNSNNKIDTMNLNNIQNLNLVFGNMIPMEKFLYNIEHVNKISIQDADNLLYASKNRGIGDLATCFEQVISKNCIAQTENMEKVNGLKILPALPVICTDGNMRSHKEKTSETWETMYNDKHFDQLWNIVNKRVYELTNEFMQVPQKHKRKIYARIKKMGTLDKLLKMQNSINLNHEINIPN